MEALIALGIAVSAVVAYSLWIVVSIHRINRRDDE